MTQQSSEILYFNGKQLLMQTEPLTYFFNHAGIDPGFQQRYTSCWRCYEGTWEISQDRLYLIGIVATYRDGSKVTLSSLFHGCEDRVFADWYSGVLRIPQRDLSYYEELDHFDLDQLITIRNGVVIDTQARIDTKRDQGGNSHFV